MKGHQRIVEWLRELGFDDKQFTDAEAKMLYRANLVPIWDFLVEHVRPAPEVAQIRSVLEANGVETAGQAERAAEEEERRALERQVCEEEEKLRRSEAECARLERELLAASLEQRAEQTSRSEVRSRELIVEAMERVLDASLQAYDDLSDRIAQETERLSYYGEDEDMALMADPELMPRTHLFQQLLSAARQDEKSVREMTVATTTTEFGKSGSDVVELMIYDWQKRHVEQFIATEELIAQAAELPSLAKEKSLAMEAVELRASLAVFKAEQERLLQEKNASHSLAQEVRDRQHELTSLQREMKTVQMEIEQLLVSGAQNRSAVLLLREEVCSVVQDQVLSVEDAFEPLAEEMRDSVKREFDEFERHSLALLLRSDVASHVPGMPNVLVKNLRIYSAFDKRNAEKLAELGWTGGSNTDGLLDFIHSLVQEARDGANVKEISTKRALALDEEIRQLREKDARLVDEKLMPLLERTLAASAKVEGYKSAVETAFSEWKNLPAQFCIPDEEQRERFMRRWNYLRVLAHEASKRVK